MEATLFITIEQIDLDPIVGNTVKVALSGHGFGGANGNNYVLRDSNRTLSVLKDAEEKDIAWYLEKYTSEPFCTRRAQHARSIIEQHATLLMNELDLDDALLLKHEYSKVVLEIRRGEAISKIHWEALEAPELWKAHVQVTTCRIAENVEENPSDQRAPILSEIPGQLNILLVVARRSDDPIDPRLNSWPLVQALQQDLSNSVSVDIARPGSKDEFVRCLGQKDYDVVHLDVHGQAEAGQASLFFQHPLKDSLEEVSVDKISRTLFVNRVKLVVLNACQSAFVASSSTANIAQQLASHGVPYVLGMTYKVTDIAVQIFMTSLYNCLLWKAQDVLAAIYQSRAELRARQDRLAEFFGLTISLQDHILPMVYAHEHQLHKHSLVLKDKPREAPALVPMSPDTIIGRDLDMLKVENHLLRDKIVILNGPHGIGKRSLQDQLGAWFKESRLVEHVFLLDGSSISTLEGAYTSIYQQIPQAWYTPAYQQREAQVNAEDSIIYSCESHARILCIKRVEKGKEWLSSLCMKFIWGNPATSEDIVPGLVLISSTTSLPSLRKEISKKTNHNKLGYKLSELSELSASKLASTLRSHDRSTGKDQYAAMWYEQRILKILQGNPLAIEAVIPVASNHGVRQAYWNLQTGQLCVDWTLSGAKYLFERWRHLMEQHSNLLKALIPFTDAVPLDFWKLIDHVGDGAENSNPDPHTVLQEFIDLGCVTNGDSPAHIQSVQLHPLFAQFIRCQTCWSEEEVKSTWRNVAAYYHHRSIEWIRTGLYDPATKNSKPKDEWEILMAILYHMLADAGQDSEDFATFDLIWIVSSFHAFHEEMPKHAVDMFADLTVACLRCIIPEFVPTSNDAVQLLVVAGLQARSTQLSEFQILRATLFSQFLIQYYYDSSLATATAYGDALAILHDSIPDTQHDEDLKTLFNMAKSICFLTDCEMSVEEGRVPRNSKLWPEFVAGMHLPSDFRTFAGVWGDTHIFRNIGLVLDFAETLNNLGKVSKGSLPQKEYAARTQPLEVLADAFEALNRPSSGSTEMGKRKLDAKLQLALQLAIEKYSKRSILDIYEKLAEVYTISGDWEAVLFALDKIDGCYEDLGRFRGMNIDEISTLQSQRWMTARRAQCYKYLGRIAESKAQIKKLRKIVSRREELWTKKDRGDEMHRNMRAMVEHNVAEDAPNLRVTAGPYVFRARGFHRDEETKLRDAGPAPKIKGSNEPIESKPSEEDAENIAHHKSHQPPSPEDTVASSSHALAGPGSVENTDGTSTSPHHDVEADLDTLHCSGSNKHQESPKNMEPLINNDEAAVPGEGIENESEGDNADDLYLILNPWMKHTLEILDNLGGTPVDEYYDFQIPPGHMGGLFLSQSRAFMVEAFLTVLGVLEAGNTTKPLEDSKLPLRAM